MWSTLLHPPPAPPGFGKGKVLPETNASYAQFFDWSTGVQLTGFYSWLSRLTLHWLGAFLNVGFSRPLMEDGKPEVTPRFFLLNILDFWELLASRHTDALANEIETSFYLRCSEEKRPSYLRQPSPTKDADRTALKGVIYDESLFKAILNTFKKRIFWSSILLFVSGTNYTLPFLCPLSNRV